MAVAWKFVQRILLIGTRNGGADPRVSCLTPKLQLDGQRLDIPLRAAAVVRDRD